MTKKILLSLILTCTLILGTTFASIATNITCKKEKTVKLAESIQKKLDSGNLTKDQIQNQYPDILEVITLSGKALHYRFLMDVDYAEITVLELPNKQPVLTDSEGNWEMTLVKPVGVKQECSFVLKHPQYPESQTGVIDVYDNDICDITFQLPDNETFAVLKTQLEEGISQALGIPYTIDADGSCQVFTTLAKSWASMLYNKFPHGEPDATAIITPSLNFPAIGPIYFNENVEPDPTLTKSSVDGGVFYANVPEGTYEIDGEKEGVEFSSVKIKARPGIIVNAAPPHGVQSDQE